MNPLTEQQKKLQTKVFEVIPESQLVLHIDRVIKYQNVPKEKDPEFWQMLKSLKVVLQDTAAEIGE